MAEAQRLKANLKLQGQPCGWCGEALALGDDAAVCATCSTGHHARCWDSSGGCSKAGCIAAPLQQLQGAAARPIAAQMPRGDRTCPQCMKPIAEVTQVCPYCNAITTPDGLYHGPQEKAPGAQASMVYGIVGLLVCGLILGLVAIQKSKQAKELIRSNPRYTGEGMATAGFVLGVIDIVAWAIVLIIRFSGGFR